MSPDSPFDLVARSTRGGLCDCWHYGAAAVATPDGQLVAAVGDPRLEAFLRSAAKPFQALPLLLAGGWERYSLEAADVALMCASHSGAPAHVERVRALLERGGLTTERLLCGSHPPMDQKYATRLSAAGERPGPLHNNCSGKHAGMLLACRLLDLSLDDYVGADHPLQRQVAEELGRFVAQPPEEIRRGIDGCSLPTYRVPLAGAARAYAALADPAAAGIDGERAGLVRRIVEAVAAEPEMAAGPGRFTTRLLQVTGGRVVGKEGASGYYAVAVRGPVAMGVALKIAGGESRCREGVVLDLLRQLGALSQAELHQLAEFHRPLVTNHRGMAVGEVVPDVELVEVGQPARL